jgi:hypothetical protein
LLERKKPPNARKKSWHSIAIKGEHLARIKDLASVNGLSINANVQRILDEYFKQQYSRKDSNAPPLHTGNT